MPRLSTAARKRISDAQKKRWADLRRQGKAGRKAVRKKKGKKWVRRGRRPGSASKSQGQNPYLQMTISNLAEAKRQLDEAWKLAARLIRRG